MSSSSWNMFDSLPGPSNIAGSLLSGAKTAADDYQAFFSPYYALRKCFERLQEIKDLIDGLSEQRRRKISIAAQSGACHCLGDIELELDRLFDEYHSLCRLYEESSIFQRHIPSTRLQADIGQFEDQVREFYRDAWKTTAPGDRSINWRAIIKTGTS